MALRNIMLYQTDDVLRKESKTVKEIDDEILSLLDDMAETMYHVNGIGLAAPQVGILKRLVVADDGNGLIVLINPTIIQSEGEQVKMEGCLSVPGVTGMIKRPQTVVVKGLNQKGRPVFVTGEGELSRILCHEIDHLDGILFMDKMSLENLKPAGQDLTQSPRHNQS